MAWVSDLQHAQAVSHMLLPDFHTRTHTGSGMGALEGGTRGSIEDERGVADQFGFSGFVKDAMGWL